MSLPKEQFISEYLDHIGYTGNAKPCLETLVALQRCHLFSVPFENLDLLRPGFVPCVDRNYLFEKIVRNKRGGVCYELNTLFYHLLDALGFQVCQISGRCMLDTPLTGHVFTLVTLEQGRFIADVGFGDDAVPPLNVDGTPVEKYHARYWIEPDSEAEGLLRLFLQRPGQEPDFQYQFGLTPRTQEDYMDTFRFSATPGNTPFSVRHICCRFTPEGKILLRRSVLTVEEYNQVVQSFPVADGEEIELCLRRYFDLP